MDCRKLLWLGGLAIVGLVGCNRHATINDGDPYSAVSPSGQQIKAPPGAHPIQTRKSDASKEVSKVLDAKPESCVAIGDLKSEIALDKNRTAEERAEAAQSAKNAYKRALQIDPKHLNAYLGMARLCTWLNQFDEAMSYYNAALAKYPKKAILHYERGMCLARQKKFDEALPNLTVAAEMEPSNQQYAKSVGLMLSRLGKADEAVAWLVKSMPEADARYNVARMMEHIGRDEEVQRQLRLALKANPLHHASLMMLNGQSADDGSNDVVQQAGHQEPAEPSQPAAAPLSSSPVQIEIGSSLPRRPEPAPTAPAEPVTRARPAPVIPVVSDQWEQKPTPPAPLDGPRATPKAKPSVQIDFDPNS